MPLHKAVQKWTPLLVGADEDVVEGGGREILQSQSDVELLQVGPD
jgi:hypothetical protein